MPSASRPPRADAAILTVTSARASDRGLDLGRDPGLDPFVGGGEMAELMRSIDWSTTAVGPVSSWPQSLRTALSIINASGYPMYLAWGPDFVQFYNDAFRPILGVTKHPAAMGGSTRMTFAEIWDAIRPLFEQVLDDGEQTYLEDALFPLDRNGFLEECYFTFSYSAIRDETGRVGGVLVTCLETTGRVLGERRLRLLRDLSSETPGVLPAEAAARAAAVLATEPRDLPFALVYLLDEDGATLTLAGASGLAAGDPLAPSTIRTVERDRLPWDLARVVALRRSAAVDGLRLEGLRDGPWPEPVERALVLPIARPNQEQLAGVLVAGLSPRLPVDDGYRGFLNLVAGQVATTIADARAYDDERRRAEALAELDRAKTAFFSDVSHEFRTPLTLLLGPLEEALADTSSLAPAMRDELQTAHRAALRLQKLVNTLLDFSRIEAGRMEAVFEPTDLAAFTADLASVFRSAVERAGVELVVDCRPLPDPVLVDRDMWEKIVLNLLSNALKFTFEGRIAIRLAAVDGAAELVIEDTGIGIAPDQLARIFERFHRVRGARARSHEGTGIGLALVQELVRLLGGSISVRSEPGTGTTFIIRVPSRHGHIPATAPAQRTLASTAISATSFTHEALGWLVDGGQYRIGPDVKTDSRAAAPAETSRPPDAARILLVDDNADMREYVARLLGTRWSVETVGDGRTALVRALADPPDLVLADIMMPGLDGFELLDELRADPRTSGVPVVLLSARAGEEARIEGLGRGADDYITKPFSARELVARMEAHLQLADHRRQTAAGERDRAARADRLAAATIAINAAATLADMLDVTTRQTRLAIGAHLAVTSLTMDRSWRQAINAISMSDRYAEWRRYDTTPDGSGIYSLVCETNQPLRLTQAELEAHPRWRGFGGDADHPPLRGWLAAPLVGRDGRNLGVIQLSDREEGDFTAEDEALLVQVAQVASIALERMQIDAARIERERQQAAVAQLGQRALSGVPVQDLLDEACRVVGDTLGVELVKVLQLLPGGAELRLVAGTGWKPGLVGTALVGAGLDSQAGYTLSANEPVIVADMADEPRFGGPPLLREHDVVSGMSVVIAGEAQPFGVLGVHTTSPRTFNAHDIDFLRSVANVVAAAVERHASEDRLAALALAERLRAGELRAVLDAMDEGIVVVDALGRVLLRNAAADALLGDSVTSFDDVRDAFDWSPDTPPPALTDAPPVERPLRHAPDRWGELRAHPVPDPSATAAGAALGTILVVRDVTEERSARTLRDAFIGVLSHELRTPITTIYAGSKLLARRAGRDGEAPAADPSTHPEADPGEYPDDAVGQGPLVADIAAEADRLYRLVEDLLVLAKFERGATEILGEPVLLQRVLPTVVRSEAARWPDARFEIDLAPDLPAVRADPTYAEQIARNLLANAAKYSEPGSSIELSARELAGEVVVRVRDEGSGFMPDEADRLFELFYRSSTVSRKPGAGIGLFVARRLVESMGGRIWAKPRSPRGAEFGFVLRVHAEEDN